MKGTCLRRIPEGMQQHQQWVWLDIAVAVEDTMPQRVGLRLTLQCNLFDRRKQMASGKRHLIEVVAVNKMIPAVVVGNKMMGCLH